ncbi:MAG: hypothetical protein HY444_09735, partial [Nitrospirae bacterium]|nr:hypothetical protein [Nitrospirota bacterium]
MRRTLEPIDLMVVIGVCATVLGGYFLFMSTSGAFEVAVPPVVSLGTFSEREWVQPVLGQAIVDNEMISREASYRFSTVTKKLDRAIDSSRYLKDSLSGYVGQIKAHAVDKEAEHAARVQFVMGRLITNGTARGVRTGTLSPVQLSGGYNHRMIRLTEATGSRMNAEFLSHRQANLDQAIDVARRDHELAIDRNQERIGHAAVLATSAQHWFGSAQETAQHQVAAAALAAIRVERQAALFARLRDAERATQERPVMQAQLRSWPEFPFGGFFFASIALIGVFLAGIMVPAAQPEEEERKAEKTYRKT